MENRIEALETILIDTTKSEDERQFYDSYVHSPLSNAQRLRKKFHEQERKIRRMEDEVTTREYDWEKRFHS